MRVRAATRDDAAEGAALLCRSIIELCVPDHGNDERAVAAWTANKTESMWITWLSRPDALLWVALSDEHLVGVCMMTTAGEILLNYVHPDARFCGNSKAMLSTMESHARGSGLTRCTLTSTRTAKSFYEALGYTAGPGQRDPLRLWKNVTGTRDG